MLARLDPRLLPRLEFPLGEQGKEETRAEARAAGLAAAERRESQEACFLAGADYRDFLARQGLEPREGAVVDEDGAELGRHTGFLAFHARPAPGPGRRRRQAALRRCGRTRARTPSSSARAPRWPARAWERVPAASSYPVERVEAKLRYRSPAAPARVESDGRGFRLILDDPAYGVAVGQAAVLYEDDAVVGSGLISGTD